MKKILLIEDEESIRAGFLELLRTEQFESLGAENGRVGVEMALEYLPDLIICDVMMPEMNGYEVLTTLRKHPSTAAIPFIFLTAKSDRADFRLGMNLGADDYLTKPCTKAELLAAISTRLAKQAALTQHLGTELKLAEEKLHYLIHFDGLTNLPNRMLLRERLNRSLDDACRSNNLVAILSIDLDRFGRLFQTLGHELCDQLLKAVSERLTRCAAGERNTVARMSEDQFVLILAELNQKEDAATVGQTILDVLAQPYVLAGQDVNITATLGISVYPSDGKEVDLLIRNAEAAMKHAKREEGNHYCFYEPEFHARSSALYAMETSLRHAWLRNELELYYQPQVDLRSGAIVGAEALARWRHPEQGMISPGIFIPVAEESGLIIPMGEWILRTACMQAKNWIEAGFSNFRMSVNLSGRQFNQQSLAKKLIQTITEAGLDPRCLIVEVTESSIMKDPDEGIKTMKELKEMGVGISIDDFGTGYSSLGQLKQFPFDSLKIDQSFVRDITSDSKNAAITIAILQMAHDMNLWVVAEGIEKVGELFFLNLHHCDAMQGFLFSPPVPAGEFERLLSSAKRLQIQQD